MRQITRPRKIDRNETRLLSAWSLILVGALLVGLLAGADDAESIKPAGLATTKTLPSGVDASVPRSGSGKVRVTLFLADNSIKDAADKHRSKLTGDLPGTTAAKRAAIRSPRKKSAQEERTASTMDDLRNAALTDLRRAGASGTKQSERVARTVKRLGGKVVDATPLPNTLTAVVTAKAIKKLIASKEVTAIQRAQKPVWASSPVDGSETWHLAGHTGGSGSADTGSSLDGNGGPDYVAFDQGTRVAHDAFKTRLPGDSASGLGSGPSRVISPAGRTTFTGSEHGNNVAGAVASTDLRLEGTGGSPFPPLWPLRKGQAFGIDKLYDTYEAENAWRWWLGITYNGEPGVTDLPEVVNYSAGIVADNVDVGSSHVAVDAIVSQFGITFTTTAGNCGIATPSYAGCLDGPHRVEIPGTNYNVITVGGLDYQSDPYNPAVWTSWANSSPGPTWGGRKKPELIATPTGGPGPSAISDTAYTNPGTGTSYAAPQAAAGAVLLASVGVYAPTAQKAILINSAQMVGAQTYWTPLTGWGALDLGRAFTDRAHYANAEVTGSGANCVRFFRQSSVSAGDRTTLVWNRRLASYSGYGSPLYNTLTDLDLIQVDETTGAATATGGVDASDTVDTNQTVSAANPMPGNGSDGGDNVEQVRSTASGTQIYKVKAMSAVDGAAAEPFSIAGRHPVEALSTPIPSVDVQTDESLVRPGEPVTVTAQVTNPSSDLALEGASVTIDLPAGVALTSGSATQALGTLAASGTDTAVWTVQGTSDGIKAIGADAAGSTYGEPFTGSGSTDVTVDGSPPTVGVTGPAVYSTTSAVPFSWSASDANGVDHYNVTYSRGGALVPLASGTTATSATVAAAEGERVSVQVVAVDKAGNASAPAEHSTVVDAVPPSISVGAASFPSRGFARIPIFVSNVGAPASASYHLGVGSGALIPLTSPTISYVNTASRSIRLNLVIEARDTLGRVSRTSRVVVVPSKYLSARLKLRSAKLRSRRLVVSGTVARKASGRVRVTARRIGRKGTRRVSKLVRVKRGRFTVKLKLRRGKYRVTATRSKRGGYAAGKSSRLARTR